MHDKLRESGVTTIYIGGAYIVDVWQGAGAAYLGVSTQGWLDVGFEVKAIEGAVFSGRAASAGSKGPVSLNVLARITEAG